MPNDFPYFQFYVDDFVSDGNVEAMTTLEVGSYILLLCKAWKEKPRGTLPNDDAVLTRWARLTPAQWSEVRPRVFGCFRLGKDGRWHQKRMQLEARKLLETSHKRSAHGRKAAEARWRRECESNARALPEQCPTMPFASDSLFFSSEGGKGKERSPPQPAEVPENLRTEKFLALWGEWQQHRKEKRAPLTKVARQRQLKKLGELGEERACAALDLSIRSGWTGVFEDKVESAQRAKPPVDDEAEALRKLAELRQKEAELRGSQGSLFGNPPGGES